MILTQLDLYPFRKVSEDHSPSVVEFATIVGSREFIAVFDNLVGTANEIEVMLVQELCDNVLAEREGNTTIVFTPSINVLVRV